MESPRKTAETLLESLSSASLDLGQRPNSWIFRGLGDAEYRLVPSALRHKEKLSVAEQMEREFQSFKVYVDALDNEGLPVPGDCREFRKQLYEHEHRPTDVGDKPVLEWPPNAFLPALALAQHYGVPTRLLDWTYDFRVAAYFAARSALDRAQAKAVAKSPEELKPEVIVYALFDAIQTPVEQRDRIPRTNDRVWRVYIPPFGNARLRAQHGLLTLYDPAPKSVADCIDERCLDELRQTDSAENTSMIRYTLPVDEAGSLLFRLRHAGISAGRIWTGYEGAALDVDERRKFPK